MYVYMITREELTKLHVPISILHHFEDGTDWEVEVHGIRIELFFSNSFSPITFFASDVNYTMAIFEPII